MSGGPTAPDLPGVAYDPWLHVAQMSVPVSIRDDMPDYLRGATNGEYIWLNADLTEVEQRCTLTHECVHVVMGHTSAQPSSVEQAVRATAATWLLPDLQAILDAARWSRSQPEMAHELQVTPRLLKDRLRTLTRQQRAQVQAASRYGFTP